MEYATLEEELKVRIFAHKTTIAKVALVKQFIEKEKEGAGILLPEPIIEQQALERADKLVEKLLDKGELDSLYENAWIAIQDKLPENFSIMKNIH